MSKWISVEDKLPEPDVLVIVFYPKGEGDWSHNINFDFIDPDCDDHDTWYNHSESYEH